MSSNILNAAVLKAQSLPLDDQDRAGQNLADYVESLAELRKKLNAGIASLDAGKGAKLDIDEVIRRARERHPPG